MPRDGCVCDAGYTGVEKRDAMQAKRATCIVAIKRAKIKAMREGPIKTC
ncbi:hypothetical protein [Ralstonia solanacearum]